MIRRVPKRGFNNRIISSSTSSTSRCSEENFSAGQLIDRELQKRGLLGKSALPLKILGDGTVTKAFQVKANKFSASAKEKIEAAGGTCEVKPESLLEGL